MNLLRWLDWVIEPSDLWTSCSDDVVVHAPIPLATKRSRRMDPGLTQALGRAVGEKELGGTGGQITKAMARFRKRGKKHQVPRQVAEGGIAQRQHRYHECGRQLFHADNECTLSVAMDGTRMGKRDCFYVAMFSPRLGKAMWCPPQAGHGGKRKSGKI